MLSPGRQDKPGLPWLREAAKDAVDGVKPPDGNAVLVVAHQPQLSRLADELACDRECLAGVSWVAPSKLV
jgi:phosphohistidine phosphatase SixA